MSTSLLSCDPEHLDDNLARAAAVLRGGGLVAFPTETVYGLGACALDASAVAGIFAAKGRPATNPVIVHVAAVEQVARLARAWPAPAERLARQFWPGPLTLVVPRRVEVPDVVTAGGPTVAVRIPAHPVALRLLQLLDEPIAAPSANLSNRLSSTRAEHVLRDLDGRIDLILDGGATPGGIESTVLDVSRTPPRLLRPGLIDAAAIERLIGPIERILPGLQHSEGALPSPGMLARHYAPRTPLECVEDDGVARLDALHAAGWKVALLTRQKQPRAEPGRRVVRLPDDAAGYAAGLYACLHQLDQEGLDRIVVALPPDEDAWHAVRDRLRRASS